jgi:hypothetical protein
MTLQEALAATHRNRPREPSMPSGRVLLRVAEALGVAPSVLLVEAEALLERDR